MSNPQPAAFAADVGDRVRLRSGGAAMTVERVDASDAQPFAKCRWMSANGQLQKGFFRLEMLEPATPGTAGRNTS
jgi:uncharacterized protein YodC (DUF2158 family)